MGIWIASAVAELQDLFLILAGVLILVFLAGMAVNTWLDVQPRLDRFRKARAAKKLWKGP